MRELNFLSTGKLDWIERDNPEVISGGDAIVRPIVVSRCDGDTLPIHHRVSRAMQAGLKAGLIDPAVGSICGAVPFQGPFAIGHEAIAEVVETGSDVKGIRAGDKVVVPWSVSCGRCETCRRGLTSKCTTVRDGRTLAAYGFGPASGPYGGMVSDLFRVPFADHMLVPLPDGLDPLRVAAASDNLSDAWRTIVPHLKARPDAKVLVVGGGAKSIGLYAAGLAVAHGASVIDYVDTSHRRLEVADSLGANAHQRPKRSAIPGPAYDIVVEASSSTAGIRHAIRATAPGGICTAVGYYVGTNTGIPLMHMYANDITLHLGVSHPRAVLPELLNWVHHNNFPAERVTSHLADFDDAPTAYAQHATKLVLHRPALIQN
ncbi:alcohol dehydrogenase [Pseudarthrobacter oxydans]|uniref:Alcohol dehydrogenase n=1 Tax=Pseudarthrobacter oxydans TaxID=1671 RepID=A0AAW8NGT5_PSEOX|nr:alcohol dehydrogenase catalytic domain-containing protein [Pseudarthrobacter oxydans]MDR7166119.1 alcohol dehydrogenase [Pseudarthrobacter oxydans]